MARLQITVVKETREMLCGLLSALSFNADTTLSEPTLEGYFPNLILLKVPGLPWWRSG